MWQRAAQAKGFCESCRLSYFLDISTHVPGFGDDQIVKVCTSISLSLSLSLSLFIPLFFSFFCQCVVAGARGAAATWTNNVTNGRRKKKQESRSSFFSHFALLINFFARKAATAACTPNRQRRSRPLYGGQATLAM
nr:hypothetical protein [Pandoravirus massiliensis]